MSFAKEVLTFRSFVKRHVEPCSSGSRKARMYKVVNNSKETSRKQVEKVTPKYDLVILGILSEAKGNEGRSILRTFH